MPTCSPHHKLKIKQLRKQKRKRRRERNQQKHEKEMEGSIITQQHVAEGSQTVAALTNEGILEILALLNNSTQQKATCITLPEYTTKKINIPSRFTPPNCRVVELGLHEILPVSSPVIPGMFKDKRTTEEKVKVMMNDKNDNNNKYLEYS